MSSPIARTTEIALAGMRFHVRVGILPHERELPQPLEIDLRVGLARDLTAMLDYRTLYDMVRSVVAEEPLDYLEGVADDIVDCALRMPGVAWARAAVRKPNVALAGPLAHAEVVSEGRNG